MGMGGRQEGTALIMVLAAIALLAVAVLGAAKNVGLFEDIVWTGAEELQTRYLARSGLGLVEAVLEEDGTAVDSYNDDWGAINRLGSVPVADVGWATARIEDEEGKVDVNRLVDPAGELDEFAYEQVVALLTLIGLPEGRAFAITDSLVDWIDEDGEVGGDGAEDTYYASLRNPYECADRPLRTVDEMVLVKGIGHTLLNLGEGEVPPLRRFLTVYGDPAGKININTAPVEVLMAVTPEGAPGVDQVISRDLAEEIVESRVEYEFETTAELKDRFMEFDNDLFNQVQPHLDVKSSTFSVDVVGESERASSRAFGVYRRPAEGSVNLVYFKGF